MISIQLDTHGYNIGDVIEFRPHNGRKKMVIGEIVAFGYTEGFVQDPSKPQVISATILAKVISSPDPTDINMCLRTGSWLSEKYCHKYEKSGS